MAPVKNTTTTRAVTNQGAALHTILPTARKGLPRRANNNQPNSNNNNTDQNTENMQTRAKRKADNSPIKNEKIKRSALGNLTNNVKVMTLHPDEDAKQQQKNQQHTKKPAGQQLQGFLDAKHLIVGNNFAVAQHIPRVGKPAEMQPPPLPAAPPQQKSQLEEQSKLQSQQQAQVQSQPPPPAQPQQVQKMTTRASRKHSQDIVEDCHRALDRIEEMASRQKRKASRKPLPAPDAPIAIPVIPPTKLNTTKPMRRISNEFNKTEESLYMSALEDVSSSESMRLSGNFEEARRRSTQLQLEKQKTAAKQAEQQGGTLLKELALPEESRIEPLPEGVDDFDKLTWNDPFQVSYYAMDIFNYMKAREKEFPIIDYMQKQEHLSKWMRTLLVDWMVEVQETFELNHETLYLAVKIVDIFLCREIINKEKLQLLGAAALFIACKFDERQPPLIEDFLYICDGAYKQDELIRMEMETLRVVDYDLGIPLSYRFLRRYARCAKVPMPTLTLARYILELALMDYATITFSDSQMAAAGLFMALRMHSKDKSVNVWTPTLIYYSGYNLADFAELIPVLNAGLHRKHKGGTIKTIRNKYSHKIFHEVAKVPLLSAEELFKNNLELNTNTTIPNLSSVSGD